MPLVGTYCKSFVFVIFVWHSSSLAAPSLCSTHELALAKSEVIKDLDFVFAASFRDPSIYGCDYCLQNSKNLLAVFLNQIPGLRPADFRILVIAKPEWLFSTEEDQGFFVRRGRHIDSDSSRNGLVSFKFHAIVEFYGHVYDLDFTDHPLPMDWDKYLEMAFFDLDI